ncbi:MULTISPECIES: hypothetical protein [unclassified Bifidobacterium]|uniref:hypothetical protein n=1 Tax=unclassified Bifidobacterium TaxID=2608897 RepID=UPI001129EC71|nr:MULTISPECIES: hypothetical protein [unclassified Bifidobacterium]
MRFKLSQKAGAATGARNKTAAKIDITGLNHADHASATCLGNSYLLSMRYFYDFAESYLPSMRYRKQETESMSGVIAVLVLAISRYRHHTEGR